MSDTAVPRGTEASGATDDLPGRRVVIGLLVVVAVLIVGFWTVWFFVDRSLLATETGQAYVDHEQSFVLADSWLAVCTVAGAVTLALRRRSALFWLLVGGGAGLYLGCMDGLYDVSRNDWFGAGGAGYIEFGIVIVTWALSIALMAWAWRNRRAISGSAGEP